MGQIKNIKLHIVTDIKVKLYSKLSYPSPNTNTRKMSLVVPNQFQHILRVMNTNIDGKTKIMYAMTSIKGVGRRFSNICLKKADIDMNKRAGELSDEEVERLVTIMQNPRQYKIPDYYLNRPKDVKDGKYSQILANGLENKLREDLERLKKIKAHRGLRLIGVSEFVDSTPHLPVTKVKLWVCPRRRTECNELLLIEWIAELVCKMIFVLL